MVVSRWLVMPIAEMPVALIFAAFSAAVMAFCWVAQISFASCSTQELSGKCWVNSNWPKPIFLVSLSKTMARDEVVPASIARIYGTIKVLVLLP